MPQLSNAEKRSKMFDLYSKSLQACFPDLVDIFVCPLCSNGFGRDALHHEGVLTLEHCISSKLGGDLETMTCGECNDKHGSVFDAHLVSKHHNEDAVRGLNGRPLKGKLKIQDVEVPVKITIASNPTSFTIQFVSKASHPDNLKTVMKEIEEKGQIPNGLKFNMSWSMDYKKRRYEVGLLRSAFLALFSRFGYRYSPRKSSQIIRDQINSPDETILPSDYILSFGSNLPVSNCVTVLREPEELRGFLVPIKSASDHRTTIKGVLLPGLDDDTDSLYRRVRKAKSKTTAQSIQCDIVPFDSQLFTLSPSDVSDDEIWESLLAERPDVTLP